MPNTPSLRPIGPRPESHADSAIQATWDKSSVASDEPERPVAERRREALDDGFARWREREQTRTVHWTTLHPVEAKSNLPYRFVPHVIEPSAGADRFTLAVLCEAYAEDEIGGEARTVDAVRRI